jgi:hypothetical protein
MDKIHTWKITLHNIMSKETVKIQTYNIAVKRVTKLQRDQKIWRNRWLLFLSLSWKRGARTEQSSNKKGKKKPRTELEGFLYIYMGIDLLRIWWWEEVNARTTACSCRAFVYQKQWVQKTGASSWVRWSYQRSWAESCLQKQLELVLCEHNYRPNLWSLSVCVCI